MKPSPAQPAFVGLGSNVQPERHLRRALVELKAAFGDLERSAVCVSPAAGYPGPDYWNLCVRFTTTLPAPELLAWLKALERRLGREPGELRFSPKTLDADLLLLGDLIARDPPLPHPEILTAPYVLGPLAMLVPDQVLPGQAVALGDLWRGHPGAKDLSILRPDPL